MLTHKTGNDLLCQSIGRMGFWAPTDRMEAFATAIRGALAETFSTLMAIVG